MGLHERRPFFEDVPSELEDAALIDGCSYLGVFGRIALPLVRPGVMATAILSFVFPVLLIALLAQRHMVTGLTFGAVKQ